MPLSDLKRGTYLPNWAGYRPREVIFFLHGEDRTIIFYEEQGVRSYCTMYEWEKWVEVAKPFPPSVAKPF